MSDPFTANRPVAGEPSYSTALLTTHSARATTSLQTEDLKREYREWIAGFARSPTRWTARVHFTIPAGQSLAGSQASSQAHTWA